MGDVVALSGTFQKPAVLRLMDAISDALAEGEPGEMTIAEAIGCLEMAKLNLYRESMTTEQ